MAMRWLLRGAIIISVIAVVLSIEAKAQSISVKDWSIRTVQQNEHLAFVEPETDFILEATISYDEEVNVSLAEIILSSGDELHDWRYVHLIPEGKQAALRLALWTPPDLGLYHVEIRVNGRHIDSLGFYVVDELKMLDPDKLLTRSEGKLELAEAGELRVSPYVRVLGSDGNPIAYEDLPIGLEQVVAGVHQGEVVLVKLTAQQTLTNIRVALTGSDFTNLTHQKLSLESKEEATLVSSQGIMTIPAGQPLEIIHTAEGVRVDAFGVFSDRIFLETSADFWQVTSFTRGSSGFYPSYRGTIEIAPQADGFLVINELPLNKYLYQVLPSEMPPNWPLEALKAQAVAARTYAVRAARKGSNASDGFHLDDSVSSQVYNNQPESPQAVRAIDETSGTVIYSNIEQCLAAVYYHSTSGGYTASSWEVWGEQSLPGEEISYLRSRSTTIEHTEYDVTSEAGALDFYSNWEIASYDQVSPWYRWRVKFTQEQLTNTINANLAGLWERQPNFVLTKTENGLVSQPISSSGIGRVKSLKVLRRGEGGNVMELEIVGTEAAVVVGKELNIRSLLRPSSVYTMGSAVEIHRFDGSVIQDYPLLPSGFFGLEVVYGSGEVDFVTIWGGGNGHGIGMSQWAARGMAEAGYSFRAILHSFYSHIELVSVDTLVY